MSKSITEEFDFSKFASQIGSTIGSAVNTTGDYLSNTVAPAIGSAANVSRQYLSNTVAPKILNLTTAVATGVKHFANNVRRGYMEANNKNPQPSKKNTNYINNINAVDKSTERTVVPVTGQEVPNVHSGTLPNRPNNKNIVGVTQSPKPVAKPNTLSQNLRNMSNAV